ncbi:MAG: NAD(P)-dependent oxidoreductase [Clostridiaceae bacterium]|nr:NAD(P)-dependent oxidoreductase [Clostridiaceae bacterium]
MRIIITGSTGFVGRELVAELLRQKDDVTVIVRDKQKLPAEWMHHVHVIEASMEQISELEITDFSGREADLFFHLAWNGTAGDQRSNVSIQLQNIQYTCDAVSLAQRLHCKKFVNAGSIMEYEAAQYLLSESAMPGSGYIYSTSKLAANFMAKTVAVNYQLDYINIVISNIYGVGEQSPRFINTTVEKMLKNETIELTHGRQLYDFIYITDASKEIVLAGKKGKNNNIYYIGNAAPKPLKDFILLMKKTLKSKSELQFGKIPFHGALLSYKEFDTEKTLALGHLPAVSFEQGIALLAKWMTENCNEFKI